MMQRRRANWISTCLALVFVALLATLGAAAQEIEIGGGTLEGGERLVPDGFLLVAENANLQLYIEPDVTQFIVYDRRNGKLWRTNPPGPHDRIPSALWRTHAQSQI